MPAVFFDSVNGADPNVGDAWSRAWKGDTRQIASYVLNGYEVHLRGYWNNQVGNSFSGLGAFELHVHEDGAVIDCSTRHNSGWVNVLGSKVWKKSYPHQTHRLFLGDGNVHGFVEGSDCAKRIITGTGGSWTSTAATDAQVVAVLDSGSVNQSRFWYWDGVSDTLYVRSTNSSTNPDVAYGGVWSCDGSDSGWADRRRWRPFVFQNCPSLYWGPVEIRGAVQPLAFNNCSGTIEPYCTDYPHYQWSTLDLAGSTSGARPSMTVDNPRLLLRRPLFSDDIMQSVPNFDDGNGQRQQGGADTLVMRDRWQSLSIYGGTLEGCVHGGLVAQWYHNLDIVSGLVQGVYFDLRNSRYARALNLQHRAGYTISSFVLERITVDGQSIMSQANLSNLTIRDSVFRNGRFGWFHDGSSSIYVDKYHPTYGYAGRWYNSGSINLSKIDGNAIHGSPITLDSVIFAGQYDECIQYAHWGADDISSPNTRIRNCWFIRDAALAGAPAGYKVLQRFDRAGTITFESNSKYYGFTEVPSGVSAMSDAERTLYTARARATTFDFSPNPLSISPSGTTNVDVTVRDRVGAAVSGFAGSVASTSDAAVIGATAPAVASDGSGVTTMPVVAGVAGAASIALRGIHGAARSTLAVAVEGTVTGIRQVKSAIATVEGGPQVQCTLTGVTPGNAVFAFVGPYFDGATAVTFVDNQTPGGEWATIVSRFHTGGVSTSIGVFGARTTVRPGTTSITVTAIPTAPTVTNAFLSLILVEVAEAGVVLAPTTAIGQSASPSVDLPTVTAPALVLACTGQSGVGNPTIGVAPGSGYSMLRVKNAAGGIGVAARKITSSGDFDPSFALASTVDGIPSSSIEWPMIAFVIAQAVPIEEAEPPVLVTASLPPGRVNTPYSFTLTASGEGPFTFTATPRPAGIDLVGATLVGSPAASGTTGVAGTPSGAGGAGATVILPLVVTDALAIVPPGELALTVGTPASVTFLSNWVGAQTWSAVGLPPGMSISTAGVLSGAPTTAGPYTATIQVAADGQTALATVPITVSSTLPAPELLAVPATIEIAINGAPVTVTITDASGAPLSSSKGLAARVEVSKPGYVAAPRFIVSGRLVLTPVGVGAGTVHVTYGDQVDEEVSVAIPVTVTP